MITTQERNDGKVLEVRATGKLAKEDYADFIPQVERLITRYGKISMLFEMYDFHGWTAGGLWQDIKFDLKHFRDIDRLAIVGQTRWQKGMAAFCKAFTTAEIRFFEPHQLLEASAWLHQETVVGV